jgi:GT2 family glycosyltransferase
VTAPEVSVVIPATREVRLAFGLEALSAQTLDRSRFEVVVVRDGRWGGRPKRAEEAPAVRFLDAETGGNIAAARNLGWRAAKGRLVAFTDDDCRPAAGWLEELVGAAGDDEVIVQGRTLPDPDERHLLYGLARSQEIVGPSPWHETCNMLYPRVLLERLGGFDERFAQLCEDTDLALRALASGAELRYADGALVYHAVHSPTLATAVRAALRRNTVPLLVARHPRQRSAFWNRLFWQRSHALLLLAIAGAVAARRRRLGLLATLPYIDHHTNWRWLRHGPRWMARHGLSLGARAAVDASEVAATLAGAVRARTLVI